MATDAAVAIDAAIAQDFFAVPAASRAFSPCAGGSFFVAVILAATRSAVMGGVTL
jgi:hypothetical protein